MFRKFYYSFGPITRRFIRRLYYFPYDFLCLVFGKRNKLVPPKEKINVGRGDFEAVGDKFFKDIVETCKISPQMHILDVECGIGRLARPFTEYLNKNGYYHGFDILEEDIKWCQKQYSKYQNLIWLC